MQAFENAYGGTPSWEIGRPQPAVLRLIEAGLIEGRVLELGCGTGDTALHLAGLGHEVVGVDFAPAAIARANAKREAEREAAAPATSGVASRVSFVVADALRLPDLGGPFDTVLDVGMFHTLQPSDRGTCTAGIRAALRPGGRCLVLAWSDRNPFGYGPERIRMRDLRAAFRDGWETEAIDPESLETLLAAETVHAWLGRFRRAG